MQEREAKLVELRLKIEEGIAAADRGDSRPAEKVFAELRDQILAVKEKARNAG